MSKRTAATSDVIALAAVQARIAVEDFRSEDTFKAAVDTLMKQAVEAMPEGVPRLVVFPEDFGAGLLLLDGADALEGATGLRGAVASLVRQHFTAVTTRRMRHRVGWVRALALHKAEDVFRVYRRTFAEAARRYDAHVLAGTVLLPRIQWSEDGGVQAEGGDVFNVAYLFGPDGSVIGSQRKSFLIDLEGSEALDLCAAPVEELAVYDTTLGRIGIAVCLDGFQKPVIERLRSLGVDIFLQPSANPQPWDEEQQRDWLNGSWKAVVEGGLGVYAVNPMLVGELLDIAFEGQSSIIARDPERVASAARKFGLGHVEDGEGSDGVSGYTDLPPSRGFLRVADSATEQRVLTMVLPHPHAVAAASDEG